MNPLLILGLIMIVPFVCMAMYGIFILIQEVILEVLLTGISDNTLVFLSLTGFMGIVLIILSFYM